MKAKLNIFPSCFQGKWEQLSPSAQAAAASPAQDGML